MERPPLADFTALNEPETRRRVEREGNYFVVEGVVAIEQLLTTPGWDIRTLALLPRVAERLSSLLATTDAPVVVVDEEELRNVVGFDLHRGALASVQRIEPPGVDTLVVAGTRSLLVVGEGLNDQENLGALYRNAGAFGAAAVLLDPTSADPFYRRSVRVSSGQVLRVPTGRLESFPGGLEGLHELGVTTVALTPSADVSLRELTTERLGRGVDGPIAIVVGAEGPGLPAATLAAAHHRVAIDMAPGVDSLNVATAAAIALHHCSGL